MIDAARAHLPMTEASHPFASPQRGEVGAKRRVREWRPATSADTAHVAAAAPSSRPSPRWGEGVRAGLLLALLLALALPLAACGKKAEPGPPSDEKSAYPRTYPRD
jgi:predicted small lipoprotein YifL